MREPPGSPQSNSARPDRSPSREEGTAGEGEPSTLRGTVSCGILVGRGLTREQAGTQTRPRGASMAKVNGGVQARGPAPCVGGACVNTGMLKASSRLLEAGRLPLRPGSFVGQGRSFPMPSTFLLRPGSVSLRRGEVQSGRAGGGSLRRLLDWNLERRFPPSGGSRGARRDRGHEHGAAS